MKFYKNFFCFLILMISMMVISNLKAETYYIGVSLPLTGKLSKEGNDLLAAIRLFVLDTNSNEKLNGHQIEVLAFDDQNDAEVAVKVARQFVATENIIGVIGSYYASTMIKAREIYNKAGILLMTPNEGSSAEDKKLAWEFNANYADDFQAQSIAVYLKEIMKLNHVLLIHNNDSFGMTMKKAFESKAMKIDLSIDKLLWYDHHKKFSSDFIETNITKEEIENFGAVVIFAHTDSAMKLVKQVREQGYKGKIFGPDTFNSKKFITDIDDKYTKDVYLTTPFLYEFGNEKSVDFASRFQKTYLKEPSNMAPIAYDAAKLLVEAFIEKGMEKKGSIGIARKKMRDFLLNLRWQTAIEGLTGNLFFSPERQGIDRDINVVHIKDGRFKAAFTQLKIPHEPYILKQLDERVAKGQIIIVDQIPYHLVDVIFVGIDFIRINDLDPRQMMYEAELFIWYKWVNEKIDITQIDLINILNKKDIYIFKENLNHEIKYRSYRVKASFQIPYDLIRFPFDSQILPIIIAPRNKNSTHLMLVMDQRHMDDAPIKEINPQEWEFKGKKFFSGLYRYDSSFGDPDYRMGKGYKSKIYFSMVKGQLFVKRMIFPYLFNLFLPLALILIIALLIFNIPVDQHVIRINASMSSLLGLLVYYMAQKSSLPRVGYIMSVDYYFIFAFIFMLSFMGVNVFCVNLLVKKEKKELAEKCNKWSFWTLISVTSIAYFILTLIFYE